MDPNAALRLIVESLQDDDPEDAADHAAELFDWLARDGFMPDVSRDHLMVLLAQIAEG